MIEAVVVCGSWEDVGRQLRSRYAGVLDRVASYRPFKAVEVPKWHRLARAFHGG
jgi:hypothetical protein